MKKKINVFHDPLVGQGVYTIILTVIALIVLLIFKPFGTGGDASVPHGDERALADTRDIQPDLFRPTDLLRDVHL